MAAVIASPSLMTIGDPVSGKPLVGAKVYYFLPGTTTPLTVFTNAALNIALPRPLLTNIAGLVPPAYTGAASYKARVETAAGVLIYEIDDVQGVVAAGTSTTTPAGGTTIPTGWLLPCYGSDVYPGWARANGRTIGNVSSAADEFRDTTAQDLFYHLWNVNPLLTVSGGRGTSAAADWIANKTITLPDMRYRVPVGRSGMGNTVDNTTIPSSISVYGDSVGWKYGAGQVVMTAGQMPAHAHLANCAGAGTHTPTGVANSAGSHQHTGNTNTASPNGGLISFSTGNVGTGGTLTPVVSGIGASGVHPNGVTSSPGAGQQFSFTTDAAGAHGHTLTMDAVANHTHTVTIGDNGGSEPHPNVQPVMAVSWMIKL